MVRKASIQMLIDVVQNDDFSRMNQSNIKGFLGELLVKHKLEDEGHSIRHLGNQSGYDLEIVGKDIRIDVKFSTLKFGKLDAHWGWALRSASKRKVTCTHFVCVAVNENFDVDSFYVIHRNHLEEFPSSKGQFNKVEQMLLIQKDLTSPIPIDDFIFCHKLLLNGKVKKVRNHEGLFDCLKEII